MDVSIKLDDTKFRAAFQRFDAESKRESAIVLKQQAKLVLRNIVSVTPPAGKGSLGGGTLLAGAARKAGEKTIESDLRRIFRPMSAARLSKVRTAQGEHHEIRFGHKGAKSLGTVKESILSYAAMAAFHRERRRKDGRVMKVNRAVTTGLKKKDLKGLDIGMVTEADFRRYLQATQKLVGLLASGFVPAAQRLGLSLPSWVTRHGGTRGECLIQISGNPLRIVMTNAVSFVGNVHELSRRAQWGLDKQADAMDRQLVNFAVQRAAKTAGVR